MIVEIRTFVVDDGLLTLELYQPFPGEVVPKDHQYFYASTIAELPVPGGEAQRIPFRFPVNVTPASPETVDLCIGAAVFEARALREQNLKQIHQDYRNKIKAAMEEQKQAIALKERPAEQAPVSKILMP
jgi:hypothetical protein